MNELEISNRMFESIKHIDEFGGEYWLARELSKEIEYTDWRNFRKVLNKAIVACKNSNNSVIEHFVEFNRVLEVGNGANMKVSDYKLSRYACYLIAQNGDSRKKAIALDKLILLFRQEDKN